LGAVEIRTDNNGDAAFQLATLIAIPNGHVIVATATNLSTNDTSEFSVELPVRNAPPAPVQNMLYVPFILR
ncbi:MAG: hypothetical protein MI924_13695, partial [Chloroflexales bacterium]|nr:hypothetical protein [Chloroflexales bacterium]